jgi:hypothetical protein
VRAARIVQVMNVDSLKEQMRRAGYTTDHLLLVVRDYRVHFSDDFDRLKSV